MPWTQTYSPLGSPTASLAVSALPIVALLVAIAVFRVRAHLAALIGLGIALAVAILVYRMPVRLATGAALLDAGYGLLPIGWLVLNVLFLYRLTVQHGLFQRLQVQVAGITPDRRLQLLLIAFCFGAFFEGCAGFGAPVAITAAMLVGLGFAPVGAARLALIANTAPVAFGSLGTPILALSAASGLPLMQLSMMVGRQLPLFSMLVPFWLVIAFAGFRGMRDVWQAIFVAGLTFAVPQFLISNFHGPWLVDVVSSLASIGCLALFLRRWQPARIWSAVEGHDAGAPSEHISMRIDWRAWMPWLILSLGVFLWGLPATKTLLDGLFAPGLPMPWLDGLVLRMPPVVAAPRAEPAVFVFNILSATGTGILASAIVAGLAMGADVRAMAATWLATLRLALMPLLTIAAMLALGYVTRYSGMDSDPHQRQRLPSDPDRGFRLIGVATISRDLRSIDQSIAGAAGSQSIAWPSVGIA